MTPQEKLAAVTYAYQAKEATGLMPKLLGAGSKVLRGGASLVGGHPNVEEVLRKALSYRLMDPANKLKNVGFSSGIGSLLGGITGVPNALKGTETTETKGRAVDALSFLPKFLNPEVTRTTTRQRTAGERMNPMLLRTLGGGVGGAAIGRYGPRLAQKGVGKVLTNVMDPIDFSPSVHAANLKKFTPKQIMSSIWNDKPLQEAVGPGIGREHHFRKFFGLEPRGPAKDYFKSVGADSYKLNPKNPDAMDEIKEIASRRVSNLENGGADAIGKKRLLNAGHMGNFHVNPDGSYKDVWDFALHPGQKLDSPEHILRAMISTLGTPANTVGKTLNGPAALRRTQAAREAAAVSKARAAGIILPGDGAAATAPKKAPARPFGALGKAIANMHLSPNIESASRPSLSPEQAKALLASLANSPFSAAL